MIFDMNDMKAMALLKNLKLAHESQAVAVKTLLAFLENGSRDMNLAERLTKDMEDGTNKIADIQDQLEKFRLDK